MCRLRNAWQEGELRSSPRECVKIATAENRREFTYRELKRFPELISHPKNTGFETRLQRLADALAVAKAGISPETVGRGRFRMVVNGRLVLDDA